jgi:hypothetical protein
MKKGIVLGIALLATVVSFSQHKQKDPEGRAAHQTEKMKTLLSLDDTQYAAVRKINEEYAVRFMTFRQEKDSHNNDRREAIKKLREEKDKELASVLTADQQTKWRSFREERKSTRKVKKMELRAKKKEDLKTTLSLTDEQALKLDHEREAFRKKIMSVKSDSGLSEADRKQKIVALKSAHESSVKNILASEQFAKWKSIKDDHRSRHHKKHR